MLVERDKMKWGEFHSLPKTRFNFNHSFICDTERNIFVNISILKQIQKQIIIQYIILNMTFKVNEGL